MNKKRKIIFLTGTRADFGKLKPLVLSVEHLKDFEVFVFVTGMHMSHKYGYTVNEVEKTGISNIHKYVNHTPEDTQDTILAKTIAGFSDYVKEVEPDMIVVHGDRPEALAGAIVGCFNNYLVAHIEGGEVSGTIDEFIRHAVTKLSHLHFVANDEASDRLRQMGEQDKNIFVIGSPDIDIMMSESLPYLDDVILRYDIPFIKKQYAITLFHPVTTEIESIGEQSRVLVEAILRSNLDYVVVYPNNDPGSQAILYEYEVLKNKPNIRVIPSMRFEHFLVMLRNSQFIIGNSSAGIREAPVYGVPTINLGTRQFQRASSDSIIDCEIDGHKIDEAIEIAVQLKVEPIAAFGRGNSSELFIDIVTREEFWETTRQKVFVDRMI